MYRSNFNSNTFEKKKTVHLLYRYRTTLKEVLFTNLLLDTWQRSGLLVSQKAQLKTSEFLNEKPLTGTWTINKRKLLKKQKITNNQFVDQTMSICWSTWIWCFCSTDSVECWVKISIFRIVDEQISYNTRDFFIIWVKYNLRIEEKGGVHKTL